MNTPFTQQDTASETKKLKILKEGGDATVFLDELGRTVVHDRESIAEAAATSGVLLYSAPEGCQLADGQECLGAFSWGSLNFVETLLLYPACLVHVSVPRTKPLRSCWAVPYGELTEVGSYKYTYAGYPVPFIDKAAAKHLRKGIGAAYKQAKTGRKSSGSGDVSRNTGGDDPDTKKGIFGLIGLVVVILLFMPSMCTSDQVDDVDDSSIVANIEDYKRAIPILTQEQVDIVQLENRIEYRWTKLMSNDMSLSIYDVGKNGSIDTVLLIMPIMHDKDKIQKQMMLAIGFGYKLLEVSSGAPEEGESMTQFSEWFMADFVAALKAPKTIQMNGQRVKLSGIAGSDGALGIFQIGDDQ